MVDGEEKERVLVTARVVVVTATTVMCERCCNEQVVTSDDAKFRIEKALW